MDWVATHFIQSHSIHSAPLVIGLQFYWQTRGNTTSVMALYVTVDVTRQFPYLSREPRIKHLQLSQSKTIVTG